MMPYLTLTMLINLAFDQLNIHDQNKWAEMFSIERTEGGLYYTGLNFNHDIDEVLVFGVCFLEEN